MPKAGVGRVSTKTIMPKYIVKFNLGTLPCSFAEPDSVNNFTKETHQEVLKEYASTLIRTFREIYIDGMENTPSSIELYRDGKRILKSDDLTENSINYENLEK